MLKIMEDIFLVFKLPKPPDNYSPLQYSITSSLKMTRLLFTIALGALPLLASAQQPAWAQCGGTGCKLYISYIVAILLVWNSTNLLLPKQGLAQLPVLAVTLV